MNSSDRKTYWWFQKSLFATQLLKSFKKKPYVSLDRICLAKWRYIFSSHIRISHPFLFRDPFTMEFILLWSTCPAETRFKMLIKCVYFLKIQSRKLVWVYIPRFIQIYPIFMSKFFSMTFQWPKILIRKVL